MYFLIYPHLDVTKLLLNFSRLYIDLVHFPGFYFFGSIRTRIKSCKWLGLPACVSLPKQLLCYANGSWKQHVDSWIIQQQGQVFQTGSWRRWLHRPAGQRLIVKFLTFLLIDYAVRISSDSLISLLIQYLRFSIVWYRTDTGKQP